MCLRFSDGRSFRLGCRVPNFGRGDELKAFLSPPARSKAYNLYSSPTLTAPSATDGADGTEAVAYCHSTVPVLAFKAETLYFGDPTYTMPLATAGEELPSGPTEYFQRTEPVLASRPKRSPLSEDT